MPKELELIYVVDRSIDPPLLRFAGTFDNALTLVKDRVKVKCDGDGDVVRVPVSRPT